MSEYLSWKRWNDEVLGHVCRQTKNALVIRNRAWGLIGNPVRTRVWFHIWVQISAQYQPCVRKRLEAAYD